MKSEISLHIVSHWLILCAYYSRFLLNDNLWLTVIVWQVICCVIAVPYQYLTRSQLLECGTKSTVHEPPAGQSKLYSHSQPKCGGGEKVELITLRVNGLQFHLTAKPPEEIKSEKMLWRVNVQWPLWALIIGNDVQNTIKTHLESHSSVQDQSHVTDSAPFSAVIW